MMLKSNRSFPVLAAVLLSRGAERAMVVRGHDGLV